MVLNGQASDGSVSPTYANIDMLQDLLKAHYSSSSSEEYTPDRMQSQYRDPPPYPGHSKQMAQPGMRQSFSGSETSTDVSVSSTENLSSSQRQEPQGEENQSQVYHHHADYSDNGYSILARLGVPTSALETKTVESAPYYGQVPHPTDHTGYLNSSYQWNTSNHLMIPGQKQEKVVDYSRGDYSRGSSLSPYHFNSSSNTTWTSQENTGSNTSLQSSYFTNLPPPPQYPGSKSLYENVERTKMRRSYETVESVDLKGSHSHPDLSRYHDSHNRQLVTQLGMGVPPQREDNSPPITMRMDDVNSLTANASKMVEMLSEENKKLREEINAYSKRVSKLQKFELEIQKVHECYESLVHSSQKRERLERMLKRRLEDEIKKLQTQNKIYREKLGNKSPGCDFDIAALEAESLSSTQKDESVTSLLAKNKELMSQKEHVELELATHRTTIQEQQAQIDILDNALTNAQANVVRLGKECCAKQVQMERLDQLQKAFTSLQATYEKREQMEKQLRTKLEKELDTLKAQQKTGTLPQKPPATENGKESASELSNIHSLQRLLNEKEAKILQLENEVVRMEQKYLEMNMRQLVLQDPDSLAPKFFGFEDTKAEKFFQMEDAFLTHTKVTELEAKVKDLQTQLAEKDAMIRVFQRSPMTRSSSVHTLNYCTPLHSPRPSLIGTGTLNRQDFPAIRHIKTGSTSALETGRKLSLDTDIMLGDSLKSRQESAESKGNSSGEEEEEEGGKVWQV